MNKELLSIITPMYNYEKYIGQTIESVLNQTYKNWEMLIVDDCSNDNSPNIVKEYVQIDNRIKYIRVNKNKGVSNARNTGLQQARGRFIAFLDSDDIWNNSKLEDQVQFMIKNDCTITFTSYELIDEDSNKLGKEVTVTSEVRYNDLLKGNIL